MNHLPWLKPPENFNSELQRLLVSGIHKGPESFHKLSNLSLNLLQLNKLADAFKATALDEGIDSLEKVSVAIMSFTNVELMPDAIIATGLRYGLRIECKTFDYGAVAQEILTPDSSLYDYRPDVILVALDDSILPRMVAVGMQEEADRRIDELMEMIASFEQAIQNNSTAAIVFQSIVPRPTGAYGNRESVVPGTQLNMALKFNQRLGDFIQKSSHVLFDAHAVASRIGIATWFDPRQWYMAKLPVSSEVVPLLADNFVRLTAAIRGKTKKCMVLDLDNTLWGGVIGDDGINGIALGQGAPAGEAFLDFQTYVLSLKAQGVILAVCSKNELAIALQPFREHPEMKLKEKDISVFIANWLDKPTNLRAIAEQLNIGTDSMVFVDDNAVERDLVRRTMPEVAVPEMPSDPAYYTQTLAASGYFDFAHVSAEDVSRADMYAANTKRAELQSSATDLASFLSSLEMKAVISSFKPADLNRVTQLINKTNQFNLTTKRYTLAEISSICEDPRSIALQVKHSDRFGDNGLISVLIARRENGYYVVDTWLMSCRVIKRNVEFALMNTVVQKVCEKGLSKIRGIYIPSGKNMLVANLYQELGFSMVEAEPQEDESHNAQIWEMDIASYSPRNSLIAVQVED